MIHKYFSINGGGFSIRCKLYCSKPESIRKVVIFGHGFSGHKDNRAAEKFSERMLKRHPEAAVIVFDWPCHGDDAKGKLRLDDCGGYLAAVIDYVKSRYKTDELYACATSFGGYLVLKYIHDNGEPFRRVALRCPAVCMHKVMVDSIIGDRDMAAIAKGKPALVGFDRKVKITKAFLDEIEAADITAYDYSSYAGDIFIVHGTKDEIVPFEISRDFAEKNGVSFAAIEAADHRFCDPDKMDEAIDKMLTFLGLN